MPLDDFSSSDFSLDSQSEGQVGDVADQDAAVDVVPVDGLPVELFSTVMMFKPEASDSTNRLLLRPESQIKGTNASETLRGVVDQYNGISGLNGNDLLIGGNVGNIMGGDRGNDRLIGGADLDFLYGGAGNDVLIGGGGGDYLQGDAGNDRLTGGAGIDQFAIQKNKGRDIITDYKDGEDKLATFNVTFEELKVVQRGANTLLQSNGSTIAVLKNVQASLITADDFVIPLPTLV